MKLTLANTLRNRASTTNKDARILNAYAEEKNGIVRVIKRPSIDGAFAALEAGAGSGQALFTWTTSAGVQTLVGIQNDVLNTSPTPIAKKLAFTTQPINWKIDTAMSPSVVVAVEDLFGNVMTGTSGTVTISLASGTATLSGTLTAALSGGYATFSNLKLDKVGSGFTFLATLANVRSATSSSFKIISYLSWTVQPSNTAPNATISVPEVSVVDSGGSVITGYSGNITVAIETNGGSPAGTLSGTLTVAAVNGVASFTNLSIDNLGDNYTLSASSDVGNLINNTSDTFNISEVLVFTTQPTTVAANTSISPAVVVTVQDPAGATITTYTGDVTIAIGTNPSSGTLSGTLTVAAVAGVATFSDLQIDTDGTGYTLTANSAPLTQATSNTFNIGGWTVTAVEFTYLSDGPSVIKREGYDLSSSSGGPYGSVNPTTFNGYTIRTFQTVYLTTSASDETLLFVTGSGLTSNLFTSITINGNTLLSSSATFTDLGTEGLWEWSTLALSAAGTYPMSIV